MTVSLFLIAPHFSPSGMKTKVCRSVLQLKKFLLSRMVTIMTASASFGYLHEKKCSGRTMDKPE